MIGKYMVVHGFRQDEDLEGSILWGGGQRFLLESLLQIFIRDVILREGLYSGYSVV